MATFSSCGRGAYTSPTRYIITFMSVNINLEIVYGHTISSSSERPAIEPVFFFDYFGRKELWTITVTIAAEIIAEV